MAAWQGLGQFVLGGEAVAFDVDVIADFNALPSRKHDEEVQLCAFDMLAVGGKDLRKLPLSMRKMNLLQLLERRPEGVFINPWRVALAPATTITGGTQEEYPFLAIIPPGALA
jgi:ATP-dependent DNA ligase